MFDVVYINSTNQDWINFSIDTVKKNMINLHQIYVINQPLKEYIKKNNLLQKIIVMEENMGVLKKINGDNIPITHLNNSYEHIKPQPINKNDFNDDSLNQYYKRLGFEGLSNSQYTVFVNKQICCTTKSLLKLLPFVVWNNKGFKSLYRKVTNNDWK